MYQQHPIFTEPTKESKIWRYMDFTKFVHLIENQSLYFSRSDKFEDPYEGISSMANKLLREQVYSGQITQEVFEQIDNFQKMMRKYTFINCWHLNDYESAAMWRLYLKTNEGIAIQTTYGNLCESFNADEKNIYIGEVKYIDYESEWMPEGNAFYPFLHKRKSFEHERELRAIIQSIPFDEEGVPKNRKQQLRAHLETVPIKSEDMININGENIKVDINKLISKVMVAPTADPWFKDLVESIMRKYELKKFVDQSTMYNSPF